MVDTELTSALKKCGAIKFGDFTLSSGKKSRYYVDIKKASTEPMILKLIARKIAAIAGKKFDRIAGVELGAVPVAVAASLELDIPLVIIRKVEKSHGIKERLVGNLSTGDRVLLVEDVVTTGRSVLSGMEVIKAAGGALNTVITVVDREEGAAKALSEKGVKLIALVKASELLELSR